MACKKCGGEGHYASTCKASGVSLATRVSKAKTPSVKLSGTRSEGTVVELGSVAEQLRARRERLSKEIETIDRLLPELEALEAMARS